MIAPDTHLYPPPHNPPLQLKTTDLAASDLNKYHKALERALLAFHTGGQNWVPYPWLTVAFGHLFACPYACRVVVAAWVMHLCDAAPPAGLLVWLVVMSFRNACTSNH